MFAVQLEKTANLMEIKASYRQLQKKCHPDILGDEKGHEMSILLNDVRLTFSVMLLCTLKLLPACIMLSGVNCSVF